jgi:hypothetical protein
MRSSLRDLALGITDASQRREDADARAEYSLMPSTTSAAITGLSRLIA